MRVGIYNRWLPTLGGGERMVFDLAQVLTQAGHQVDLLTHVPITLESIEQRLGIELDQTTIRSLPDSPGNQRVSAISSDYDLFINASQGDLFRSRARHSMLLVHNPAPLVNYASGGMPSDFSLIAPSRVRWLSGVYGPESDGQQWWVWAGQQATVEVERRWPTRARTLLLRLAPIMPPQIAPPHTRVLVNGVCVGERNDRWSEWRIPLPSPVAAHRVHAVELQIAPWTLRDAGIAADDRERGVPLQSIFLLGAWWEERLHQAPLRSLDPSGRGVAEVQQALDSYDVILGNSRFTQQWIERRWNRSSEVLYPGIVSGSVSLHAGLTTKQPMILSVGRFFTSESSDAHNKKHLPMIQAFKTMCDNGLRGWVYHLVGGCDLDQPEQRAYLQTVQNAATGYPIVFHVNAPGDELRSLYADASIFWHATGYGEDEARGPETMEHFGMTTVEAMAAGCVPVVIAKAGQLETVEPERSGLLWQSLDELQAQTRRVINDQGLWQKLARGAIERSRAFGMDVFAARVHELIAKIEADH